MNKLYFVQTKIGKIMDKHSAVINIYYGILIILIGCKCFASPESTKVPVISEESSRGPVRASISLVPASVKFDREMIMRLYVTAPSEVEIKMPALRECVEGFTIANITDEEFRTDNGIAVTGKVVRLIPYPASEYWIGPIVIEYLDQSHSPAVSGWITLKPLRLECERPANIQTNTLLSGEPDLFVPEEKIKRYAIWFIPIMISSIVFITVFMFLRRNQKKTEEEQLTPYQLALKELDKIQQYLNSGWDNNVKLVYTELTETLRRYIADTYLLNARNLTTMELIQSLAPQLSVEALNKLNSFLEMADTVKFAAYSPSRETVMTGPSTMRKCLEVVETSRKYQIAGKSNSKIQGEKRNKDVQIC